MSRLRLGKPSRETMAGLITRFTGAKSSNIIVGPKSGVDVSVLRIDKQRVMIVSCDPVSFIPALGPRASAKMSVFEVASDVATSGVPPKYAVVDLNLPPHLSDEALSEYWKSFHNTCLELGLSVVGGHTGRFQGCDYSIIGGATLWTFAADGEYVTSMMAEDGDDLILTKSAGYGATSVLTRAFPQTARRALGQDLFEKAHKYFPESNTVKDAVAAARTGVHSLGVTAMHDATEGGVIAALLEIANASNLGGTVFLDRIPISEETRQLCKHFRIDPLRSLGEGSLVVASKPHRTGAIIRELRSKRIKASVVGELSSKARTLMGVTKRKSAPLSCYANDPYWNAYSRAIERGWS